MVKVKNDLTGKVFGRLTVLEQGEDHIQSNGRHVATWKCQCSCKEHNIITVQVGLLTKKQNPTRSCGCLGKEARLKNVVDMTGWVMKDHGVPDSRWTVLYRVDNYVRPNGATSAKWHCRCECGNEKDVVAEILRRGESKSCGCLQREISVLIGQATTLDITGERYGKLVALSRIASKNRKSHAKWLCKCDCGNMVEVDLGNLRSGKSQSCGCIISRNEEYIIKLLSENNISFQHGYTFAELPQKTFDFYVNNEYIIEFDGQQHFTHSEHGWSTQEHFERTHKSDLVKNKFCYEHNIPLIRIPYNKIYEYDDLLLETTRFLYTPDIEEKYYTSGMLNRKCYDNDNSRREVPLSNTSGCPGVVYHKKSNSWVAVITIKCKTIYLGTFKNKEDAIRTRLTSELKLLGSLQYKTNYDYLIGCDTIQ